MKVRVRFSYIFLEVNDLPESFYLADTLNLLYTEFHSLTLKEHVFFKFESQKCRYLNSLQLFLVWLFFFFGWFCLGFFKRQGDH